jgi:hypothetical protein
MVKVYHSPKNIRLVSIYFREANIYSNFPGNGLNFVAGNRIFCRIKGNYFPDVNSEVLISSLTIIE